MVLESSDSSDSEEEGPLAAGLTPQRHPHQRPPSTLARQRSLSPLSPQSIPFMDEALPDMGELLTTAMNTVERTTNVSQFISVFISVFYLQLNLTCI